MYWCESWTLKKAECQRIDAFELWCWRKTQESLGLQGDQTSQSWGKKNWIFFGRTDAETPILWPPDVKSWLIEKDPWCWERLKAGEEGDKRGWDIGWHHWLKGHEFEQTPRDGEGQGSLVCCSPWGHKESDVNERLNNNQYASFSLSLKTLSQALPHFWILHLMLCKL